MERQNDKSLRIYLEEIAKYKSFSIEEEKALFGKIEEGCNTSREKIINANLQFVVSVAKRYKGLPLLDLISEGNVGLMVAINRFNYRQGTKFITYAVHWIRQSILLALSKNKHIVALPLNRQGAIMKLNKAFKELYKRLDRTPTEEELLCYLGINQSDLYLSMAAAQPYSSLDKIDDDNTNTSLLNYLADNNNNSPVDYLEKEELELIIRNFLKNFTTKEQTVIKLYFGLEGNEKYSLEGVGQQLNLSRERIRQIKKKILNKLQKSNKYRILRKYRNKGLDRI